MEELYKTHLVFSTKIANSFKNFKSKGQAKMTRGNAKARLEGLESPFQSLSENHAEILALSKAPADHEYFTQGLFSLAEENYYDRKGDFNDYLEPSSHSFDADQFVVLRNEVSRIASFSKNRSKIDIPKYSGKYSDWENFRDVFLSIIGDRADLTPVLKLYFLRISLTDDTLDKIKNLSLINENNEKAWEELTDYYENKRRLVNSYISQLFSVKPMKSETSAELKRLFKEITTPLDVLTSLKRPVDKWGDIIVFFTVSKLETSLRKDWEKEQGNSTDIPTYDQLKKVLSTEILTLESIEGSSKISTSNSSRNSQSI